MVPPAKLLLEAYLPQPAIIATVAQRLRTGPKPTVLHLLLRGEHGSDRFGGHCGGQADGISVCWSWRACFAFWAGISNRPVNGLATLGTAQVLPAAMMAIWSRE